MLCFAMYGAKVLERRSVEIAMRYKVPLKVIKTNSHNPGTNVIQKQSTHMESCEIKGISLKNDIIFCQIQTSTHRDLYALMEALIKVTCFNLIVDYNENTCKFEAPLSENTKINAIVQNKKLVSSYMVDTQSALVVIVGWSIGETCDLLIKVWKELNRNQVKIQNITSDTHCIKIKVSLNQGDTIVKQLHKALIEGDANTHEQLGT